MYLTFCNHGKVLNASEEDSALFTCILTRAETGDTEAREDLRLVIFDKRDLTRGVVAEKMDELWVISSADSVYSIIIIEVVLFVAMLVPLCFTQYQ